jgi:hypothetical protein
MRFNHCDWQKSVCGLLALIGLTLVVLLGCDARVVNQEDVSEDAAQRVEDNILPPLLDESSVVMRNLMNLLPALPEICATRLARLGSFVSSVAALGRPEVAFDDEDGTWEMRWRNVILGDNDGPPTTDAEALPVDITMTVAFRSEGFATLRAIPFTLAARSELRTTGEPPAFAAGDEGFFLFQDAETGEWTLRWRALDTPKVFAGQIDAPMVSRLLKRIGNGPEVSSLTIGNTQAVTFSETTAVDEEKGFTFFVEPGETVRFRLRIGLAGDEPQGISREQLRIGGDDQLLPANQDPADFHLASNVPIVATTMPRYIPGSDFGSFIWQDIEVNNCRPGEDQWRIRFSKNTATRTFSGAVEGQEDDDGNVILSATPVGSCPDGSVGEKSLEYDCPLEDDIESGYDVCVTAGTRLLVSLAVDDTFAPGLVFIGGEEEEFPERPSPGAFPPSPDPFTIFFDIDLTELQSPRALEFRDSAVVMRGNNEDRALFQLNPAQVSLEPLCSIPGEQPRVRFTGQGEYSTERFGGSLYVLNDVEFTHANLDTLRDGRRFPDRGEIRLETRQEDENADIIALPERTLMQDDTITIPVDVEVFVNNVLFTFTDRPIDLTVE